MKIYSNLTGEERRVCDRCSEVIELGTKYFNPPISEEWKPKPDMCQDCMYELLSDWETIDRR